MANKNKNLNVAARAKKDEFYTQLEDIERELSHEEYREFFKGKIILCNCDDPYESEFFKYFAMNFNALELKKLIVTCYSGSPISGVELSLFPEYESKPRNDYAYKVEINELKDWNGDGREDLEDIKQYILSHRGSWERLNGNGDFRSAECIELLKEADVVVTNPPFSLFREYVAQLFQYDKKFVILGNKNAITYKEIFPLIQQNKIWVGYTPMGRDLLFTFPEKYKQDFINESAEGSRYRIIDGKMLARAAAIWYTNIPLKKYKEDLPLVFSYYENPEKYPKYDNYDAIEVSRVAEIPYDYKGAMGVPITFLDKHNPDQFEIVKFRKGDDEKDLTYTVENNTILTPNTKHQTPNTKHQTPNTKHQTPKDNYTVLQNPHQTESVTELWACQSHSSTNIIPTNLKYSVAPINTETAASIQQEQLGEQKSTAKIFTSGSSSGVRCNGVMGVPITFLDKYCPEQFEIIGATESEGKGFSNGLWNENSGIAQAMINGQKVYKRIFIRRRA